MTTPEVISKLEDTLGRSIGSFDPSDILFFTGAGISTADPTGFPLGNELHTIVLEASTDLNPDEITHVISGLKVPLERSNQIILEYFNDRTLTDPDDQKTSNQFLNLLSFICEYAPSYYGRASENLWKQPNEYHAFFHNHIKNGGRHITANLDQFIEYGDVGFEYYVKTATKIEEYANYTSLSFSEGTLFKFHGDPNIDEYGLQGLFESVLANGFTSAVKSYLDSGFKGSQLVVFVGYGGWDDFDMNPYLNERATLGGFPSTDALWIQHGNNDLEILATGDPAIPTRIGSILAPFRASSYVVGRSDEYRHILNSLLPATAPIVNTSRGMFRRQYRDIFIKNLEEQAKAVKQFADYKKELGEHFRNLR